MELAPCQRTQSLVNRLSSRGARGLLTQAPLFTNDFTAFPAFILLGALADRSMSDLRICDFNSQLVVI